jgi:YVTN family beta-propeller protein
VRARLLVLLALCVALLGACHSAARTVATSSPSATAAATTASPPAAASAQPSAAGTPTPTVAPTRATSPTAALAGMPPLLDPRNAYAADRPGLLSPTVRDDRPLVYVPNSKSNTVDVIDQKTYKIIRHFAVGGLPQHVVPSYDLKTLWVNNNDGYTLTPIDPRTGAPGRSISVVDPYNLYFTPDGKYAMVMAEKLREIIFSDPHTFKPVKVLRVPQCGGVNHADFSLDGRYFIATCEFSGRLIKVDVQRQRVVGSLPLTATAMPQDIKVAPDGSVWYVADMMTNGVWLIDGDSFRKVGFLRTGLGTHGLYPMRDAKSLLVTNRGEGSISKVSFATRRVIATWRIPGGGSPDMGGLNAAGTVFWVSGRYNGVVYAIDTRDGHLIRKIRVGSQPHGLCVYPQPGRYSLGHTGIFR